MRINKTLFQAEKSQRQTLRYYLFESGKNIVDEKQLINPQKIFYKKSRGIKKLAGM
jgi:hypothetical protein